MQVKKLNSQKFVIRLSRGESIIQSLKTFCKKNKVFGGFFFGIGAVDQVELAHYDVEQKKYSAIKFKKPLEMTSLIGSIGAEKELIIHAHANLTDTKMKTIGGHLVEGKISGTAEILLFKTEKLTKKYDPETGLKLFDI